MTDNAATPAAKRPRSAADRWVRRGFVLAILIAAGVILYYQWRGLTLGWGRDLPAALAQAKAEGRKVVVFVHSSPDSDAAKDMVKTTLAIAGNKKALTEGKFITVEVWLDKDAVWAKKYGVTRAPTMLLIAPDGDRFHKQEGFIGETDFRQKFLKALDS